VYPMRGISVAGSGEGGGAFTAQADRASSIMRGMQGPGGDLKKEAVICFTTG